MCGMLVQRNSLQEYKFLDEVVLSPEFDEENDFKFIFAN